MRAHALRLAALAAVLVPASARAVSVAVPEIGAPPNLSGIAARLTQDVVGAATAEPNHTIVGPAEVTRTIGADALARLQACGRRPACVVGQASRLTADRIVFGRLERNDNNYAVWLFLVDLKSGALLSSIDRSIPIASRRLQRDVVEALPALLRGQAEASGRLSITANPRGAEVVIDGQPAGTAPLTVQLKPGKHTVALSFDKYLPVERFVDVEAGSDEQLAVTLTLVPGARVVEDDLLLPEATAAVRPATEAAIEIPTSSWIALGAAAVAAGCGSYFALRTSALQTKAGAADGVWEISRSEAIEGRSSALAANVGFGLAGAGAATAVILAIVHNSGSSPAPAAVLPAPGGAALAFGGSF